MRVLIVLGLILLMGLTTVPSVIPPARAVCAPPVPDFDIEADPSFLTLPPGDSKPSTITVTSIDEFKGIVSLSATVVDPDMTPLTAAVSPTTVDLTGVVSGTSTLTVTANSDATPGFYSVSADSSAIIEGILVSHSAFITVEVPAPDFSLEAVPAFLTLDPGQSKTSTIAVTSENGFEGTVSLSTTIFPTPDLTASLTDSVTLMAGETKSVELTVISTDSTPAGSYGVEIKGEFGTIISHSIFVDVTVTGPDFIFLFPDPFLLTVSPGSFGTSKMTLESLFGFSGSVVLEVVSPLPPGITAAPLPTPVFLESGGTATSTLTVTVDSSVVGSPFPIPIHVIGTSGSKVRPTIVLLLVPGPDLEVSANPASLPIDPGASGTSTVTVKSIFGFAGTVALTAEPDDPCLEVTPSSASITLLAGDSEVLTLSIKVDSVTPDGTYFVDVDGMSTSGPLAFGSADVEVTVGDVTPPTWPPESSLISSAVGETSVTLSWTAATDDVGIESYDILQDDVVVATVLAPTTTSTITGLSASTTYDFQIVAYDAAGNPAPGPTATVTTAAPVNDPPVLSAIGDKEVNEGVLLTFTASATDPEGDSLAFSLDTGAPSGASISSGGVFTWTPTEAQGPGPGSYSVTVIVTDSGSPPMSDSETIAITVAEVNRAPTVNVPGVQNVALGSTLTFTVTAADPDIPANSITLSAPGLVTGMTFTPATGVFSFNPVASQNGMTFIVSFTATDNGTPILSDTKTVSITVSPNTLPAVLVPGAQTVNEGSLLTFTVSVSDAEAAQTVTLSASGLPTGPAFPTLTGNPVSGTFSWTPSEAQGPGDHTVTFTADDGVGGVTTATVAIHVNEVNQPPVLGAIGNKSVNEETVLTFTVSVSDPDIPANTLTCSLGAGAPPGAAITAACAFSWTPTEAQGQGTFTVTFTATDNGTPSRSASETITITVDEVNQAPVLPALGSKTVTQGSQLTFTITANDLDIPHTLTYSLEPGAPTGASITASGGVFTWTPTADQGPGTYTIIVRASDGTASDTESFTVTVSGPPQAPAASRPFWEEYWYVLLIVVLVLVGIPVVVKVREKPGSKS